MGELTAGFKASGRDGDNADPDGGFRGAAVRQDWRSGGRARRLAAGAGHAWATKSIVVMPRYGGSPPASGRAVTVALGGQVAQAGVFDGGRRRRPHGVHRHPAYYDREYLYGAGGHDYPDNPERFAFLAQAALNWAASTGERLHVAHAHDWQAALLPMLAQRMFRTHEAFLRLPTVLTIHNLAYQGVFDASWLAAAGPRLGPDASGRARVLGADQLSQGRHRVQPAHHDRQSPRTPRRFRRPSSASASTASFGQRRADLVGILNGIDYDQWDPARDPHLPVPFSASKLEGKAAAKRKVLESFGLPLPTRSCGGRWSG